MSDNPTPRAKADAKPIRVFYSDLTGRFYATRNWRQTAAGHIEITGERFDVTNDIASVIVERGITFLEEPGP